MCYDQRKDKTNDSLQSSNLTGSNDLEPIYCEGGSAGDGEGCIVLSWAQNVHEETSVQTVVRSTQSTMLNCRGLLRGNLLWWLDQTGLQIIII